MKKSRFIYLHPEANVGKVAALEDLQETPSNFLNTVVLSDECFQKLYRKA